MNKYQLCQAVACLALLFFVFFLQDVPFSLLWFILLVALNLGLLLYKRFQGRTH
ncbi:hypothetical protein MHB73_10330 [Bacillus sp. FSL K6-6483]|uniref:hypothetical protein n=1 Tax=Shouchella clausii TaxID=79880 RepID=UPI00031D0A8C|nr:hypothetical protein [Shouchella clausii]MCM3313265.1 hypothetical protein [Psychrobacillus sp. MER TA 17]